MSQTVGRSRAGPNLTAAWDEQPAKATSRAKRAAPTVKRLSSVIGREPGIAFIENHAVKIEDAFFCQGSASSTLRRLRRPDHPVFAEADGSAELPEPTDTGEALFKPPGSAPRYQRLRDKNRVVRRLSLIHI